VVAIKKPSELSSEGLWGGKITKRDRGTGMFRIVDQRLETVSPSLPYARAASWSEKTIL